MQETSADIAELEGTIAANKQTIERLQDEVLSLTVRKEILAAGMEKLGHRHHEQLEGVACQQREIDAKISQYAVLAPPPSTSRPSGTSSEAAELARELECPVCMEVSRPPIYQCEEGHIICATCKPLLASCPHCAKTYSNPVIRCRFAEKLSERYFAMVEAEEDDEEEAGEADDAGE